MRREASMLLLRKILMTTDMSVYSLAGVQYFETLALASDARLYLLYVMESGGHHFRTVEEAKRSLEEFARSHLSPRLGPRLVVRTGSPAEEIKRFAEDEGVDVVIMATHGRTGLRHMLMGSVAEKVVRICGVPVLTVKPAAVRENLLGNEDIESELHLP